MMHIIVIIICIDLHTITASIIMYEYIIRFDRRSGVKSAAGVCKRSGAAEGTIYCFNLTAICPSCQQVGWYGGITCISLSTRFIAVTSNTNGANGAACDRRARDSGSNSTTHKELWMR
jgi:hypothetical protein